MMDANGRWGVDERSRGCAISPSSSRGGSRSRRADDVLGHATIARAIARSASRRASSVRTAVVQAVPAGARHGLLPDRQLPAGRRQRSARGAADGREFGVPVCPHAGGVGLCEYVQHLAVFDYIAVSASLERRVVEYVDHLHEHFVDAVVVDRGRYRVPTAPGTASR
jgi:L-fuconate dehydratase